MSGLLLRYLAYFGPDKAPAELPLESGLNVICGASETGKSFIAESIDFMLGQAKPVRDIPERAGYDRSRLIIESEGWPPLSLDRSVEGGDFAAYEEEVRSNTPQTEQIHLRYQHSAARQDTLSYQLLERIGLSNKTLRRNASGATRSLSFRDLARLCIVTEEEIQTRQSPLTSGQFVTATGEYAAFKLLLTGTDDSALVEAARDSSRRDLTSGKIEVLNQLIEELQLELDEDGADEAELNEQLERLQASIEDQNAKLKQAQSQHDDLLTARGQIARELQTRRGRLAEIEELVGRFQLLDSHYLTDLNRLEAIHESGSLFVHLEQDPCPLCGAQPGEQHLETECDGNTEAVVEAANAEMEKIVRLRRELEETLATLREEDQSVSDQMPQFQEQYQAIQEQLSEIANPAALEERETYDALISERAEVRALLDKIERLRRLIEQRDSLESGQTDTPGDRGASRTMVPTNVLDDFSQTVEGILEEWHFPNTSRVFFDESKRDFQIGGKERGSTGKGLRAITHAAVTIGLMVYCRERDLPHPGFVVLDSPLLAYWKPEGDEDDLRGTDLKERFYRYLVGLHQNSQVIVIENEHPPEFVIGQAAVTIFTKNPNEGRYGFFPPIDGSL